MKQPEPISHFRRLESAAPVHRYLDLKARIKALTAEMKELEAEVWDAVDDEGGAVAFAGHTLEACVSRTYTYSPAVQEAEADLRRMKEAERHDRTAIIERATGYVRVSEPRPSTAERTHAAAVEAASATNAEREARRRARVPSPLVEAKEEA